MKIKVIDKTYEEVLAIPQMKAYAPKRVNIFWRTLMYLLSKPTMNKFDYSLTKVGMEKLGKQEPCLYLMNHSSFTDMKMASVALFPKRYNVVCTFDALMGKKWLMKQIGCVPTHKYVNDISLVRTLMQIAKKNNSSILLYPEACYSADGKTTVIPDSVGGFIKMLDIPVVMITTSGAFARDPLYNNLQIRKVKISAEMKYVLSPAEIKEKSVEEINKVIFECFDLDYFKWQKDNKVKIDEPFRAEGLNRVLYKCPHCEEEGVMETRGCELYCSRCGHKYVLDEYGYLVHEGEGGKFDHVPDWYAWERAGVRAALEDGTYRLEDKVDIYMLVDTKALYRVGEGEICQTPEGIRLTGLDGKLDILQKPQASYTLNTDFNWYELGDIICLANQGRLYYCFPKTKKDIVSKARLATEESFKIFKENKALKRE